MALIDHLVYAVPDLAEGIERFAAATGIAPAFGGVHVGMGTHNALVSFGSGYIELIAPDPEQPDPRQPRPFGIDALDRPTLVTFAIRPDPDTSIDGVISAAEAAGYESGPIAAMSRRTPAGALLEWRLTFPQTSFDGVELSGAVPFVIDWGETARPNTSAPGGIELHNFTIGHPNAAVIHRALTALGLATKEPLRLEQAATAALTARVVGPTGTMLL